MVITNHRVWLLKIMNEKRKVSYFQLGSVSPTSFKINPIASGIVLITQDENNELHEKIYDNDKLIMYSIDKKSKIDKLVKALEQIKDQDIAIFLKYPLHLKDKLQPVIEKYTVIKGVEEFE